MSESTQLAALEGPAAVTEALLAPTPPQQLLAIDPEKYCALVFEPFREKLDRYKAEADAVTFDVTTAEGMKTAIMWRAKFRDEIRIAAESARKERKAPILEIGRLLDNRAKEIAKEVAPYEARFDDAITAEQAKRDAAKKAKEEAERSRIAEINRRLGKLESLAEVYTSAMAPERLMEVIQQLEAPAQFDYQEFSERAAASRQTVLVSLRAAHVEALERLEREASDRAAREAEEARKAAERAEQERIEAEQRAAEQARAEEERHRIEAEQAAEAARLAEVRRKLDAEQAEQRRVAAIRERIRALNGPDQLTGTSAPEEIERAINILNHEHVDDGSYEEFYREASAAQASGIARLTELCNAAHAHQAEQARLAAEREDLERQKREQAERQAEIDRQEQAAREAKERQEQEAAETEARRQAEEQARRETEARATALRERVASLDAIEIAQIVADAIGCSAVEVATRIGEIGHDDWIAIAVSEAAEAA